MNEKEQRLRNQYVDVNFDMEWEEISKKLLEGNMDYLQGAQDVLHYFISRALLDEDFVEKAYRCLHLTYQQQTVELDRMFEAQESREPDGKNHFASMFGTMLTPEELDIYHNGPRDYRDTSLEKFCDKYCTHKRGTQECIGCGYYG